MVDSYLCSIYIMDVIKTIHMFCPSILLPCIYILMGRYTLHSSVLLSLYPCIVKLMERYILHRSILLSLYRPTDEKVYFTSLHLYIVILVNVYFT